MARAAAGGATTIHDLPDAILSSILASVTDTRARNAAALVCRKWLVLERGTRTSLTLRGNVVHNNLYMIPTCFRAVTHLDLSLLSPWGHSLISPSSDPMLLAHLLRHAFPMVTSLTVYARTPATLQLLAPQWPNLTHIKLVKWHQRSPSALGSDFDPILRHCTSLTSVDLSNFYYWTEDLPPALQAHPATAAALTRLDLMTLSFAEGFKSHEILAITAACPNLQQLLIACTFDPRYIGFVGDEAIVAIASNCPGLTVLHLADTASLSNGRGDPEEEGFSSEDAGISTTALSGLFSGLPLLQELVLDVCKNVRDSGATLEMLNSRCPKLRVLKLGHFHGLCLAIGSQLDGVALCQGLESLSIKNSADLTDMGLIAIARGCSKLAKFEIHGCKKVTWKGISTMACLRRSTLVEFKISCCKNLDAVSALRGLEPIRDRIQRLHIDCIWDRSEQFEDSEEAILAHSFDLNELEQPSISSQDDDRFWDHEASIKKKKRKYTTDLDASYEQNNGNGICSKTWERLQCLSLWIGVGELLPPLAKAGLDDCPCLEEIQIKVEGDCRERSKPSQPFGLSSLMRYPRLSKMKLDCGDTIGYALTAPSGQTDLSTWERFYLNGIKNLTLNELDYWPPQDKDVNHRSLSLPSAGLLAECVTLRKLFIHGTAHEHFMTFLLAIPNLRDVQLREDYYPAPENDMSTEMRIDSCSRFEDALNRRRILD